MIPLKKLKITQKVTDLTQWYVCSPRYPAQLLMSWHTHPNMCLIVSLLLISSLYLCKHSSSNKHESRCNSKISEKIKKNYDKYQYIPTLYAYFVHCISKLWSTLHWAFWRYPNDNKAIAFKQRFNGGNVITFTLRDWIGKKDSLFSYQQYGTIVISLYLLSCITLAGLESTNLN